MGGGCKQIGLIEGEVVGQLEGSGAVKKIVDEGLPGN